MKVHLMYQIRDFDMNAALPLNGRELIDDLELDALVRAMAGEDEFLRTVARTALLTAIKSDSATVRHRQAVLRDALEQPDVVRQLYQLSIDALELRKKSFWGVGLHYPLGILHGSTDVIEALIPKLKALREIADRVAPQFSSFGWKKLFATLSEELDEDYIEEVQTHLKTLKFRHGILVSAHLSQGNRGDGYVLRTPSSDGHNWLTRLFTKKPLSYQYTLAPRDENGARALLELADRGINLVANALAQSAEHIASFFTLLRAELAFYVCCINLHESLSRLDEPIAFPDLVESNQHRQNFEDLYDVCLALKMGKKVVPNTLDIQDSELVIITGANQGGKSSFLRSMGLAQLMMQSGMFVGARAFSANLCEGIYTHYKREEDTTMHSGKFDEELKRMSAIVDQTLPGALVLFNESFSSTNEREGSQVAQTITEALLERHIKVFFVTHQYAFAHGLYARPVAHALYLRAERLADGSRTFRIIIGEPEQTSYGADLYREVFESAADVLRPAGKRCGHPWYHDCAVTARQVTKAGNQELQRPRAYTIFIQGNLMTTLILMRHGHVEGIHPERFRGRAELPLSPLGQRQAEALAQRVAARFSPVALYTSPMARSIATGAPMAQALGLASRVLDGLQDLDYGQWQGLTHDEVSKRWPELYNAWYKTPQLLRFPGGESLQDLVARTADGLRTVLARHPGKSDLVLLIGHDSVNRALLLQLADQPLSAYWRLAQSPCCINHIEIHDSAITIRCINDTAHLEKLSAS